MKQPRKLQTSSSFRFLSQTGSPRRVVPGGKPQLRQDTENGANAGAIIGNKAKSRQCKSRSSAGPQKEAELNQLCEPVECLLGWEVVSGRYGDLLQGPEAVMNVHQLLKNSAGK